jgi:TolB-like protein
MASPATDVFLSYKAEDRPRLSPLVEALEAEGFTVWWDAQIGGGTNWQKDIEQHLDGAKCVVVAWTKRSVGDGGHFVRDEARRAQRRGAYVPVCLDGVEPPLGFGEIQALSLRGWKRGRSDCRFQAVANAVRSRISGKDIGHGQVYFPQSRVSRRAAIGASIAAGAIAAAATGSWLLMKPAPANAKRIAVLPFANLSSDPDQAYFSEGVPEELRAALSRIGLEVIGRASSDAVNDLDTVAAATKLGVANILTGSVRRSPRTIRINAQLLGGTDGVEHWAQSYDRAPGDAIKIQTDIATNVAQALSIAFGQAARAAITLGGTADSVAQDLVLRGDELRRKSNSEETLHEVISLADAAIARDPNYAEAYVLRAGMLVNFAGSYAKSPAESAAKIAQAAAVARGAIALAPKLGIAYGVFGWIELNQLNFAGALHDVRQALSLSPNEPRVITAVGQIIAFLGSEQEALHVADRMIAIDPLEPRAFGIRASTLMLWRHYSQSIAAGRRALELSPGLNSARSLVGNSLTLTNQPSEALAEYRQMPADDAFRLTGEAIVAARSRDFAGVDRYISHMRNIFGATPSYQYAEIYAQAGDASRALAELDSAMNARDPGLGALKTDPFLDPIRGQARYAALLKRLNFPAQAHLG